MHDENFHRYILACFLIFVGCALLVAGFTVDPTGIIHPSVLAAFGEILCFVGALEGIEYHKNKTK